MENQQDLTHLPLKEVAARVRNQLKVEFPACKFSIRTQYYSMGQSLHVSVMKADRRVKLFLRELPEHVVRRYLDDGFRSMEQLAKLQESAHHQLSTRMDEEYSLEHWNNGVFLTLEGHKMVNRIMQIINQYNYDRSEPQTDYFDVHFYTHLNLGQWNKPFIEDYEIPLTCSECKKSLTEADAYGHDCEVV